MSKKVLFICKGNWFRSQMAAAIYNKLTNSKDADSVGTYTGAPDEPEGQILSDLFKTNDFFELLEKNGMNVRSNTTKRLQPQMIDKYEIVVSMAEEPYIPDFLKKASKVIRWEVENPKSVDKEKLNEIYNKVYILVSNLLANNKLNEDPRHRDIM